MAYISCTNFPLGPVKYYVLNWSKSRPNPRREETGSPSVGEPDFAESWHRITGNRQRATQSWTRVKKRQLAPEWPGVWTSMLAARRPNWQLKEHALLASSTSKSKSISFLKKSQSPNSLVRSGMGGQWYFEHMRFCAHKGRGSWGKTWKAMSWGGRGCWWYRFELVPLFGSAVNPRRTDAGTYLCVRLISRGYICQSDFPILEFLSRGFIILIGRHEQLGKGK